MLECLHFASYPGKYQVTCKITTDILRGPEGNAGFDRWLTLLHCRQITVTSGWLVLVLCAKSDTSGSNPFLLSLSWICPSSKNNLSLAGNFFVKVWDSKEIFYQTGSKMCKCWKKKEEWTPVLFWNMQASAKCFCLVFAIRLCMGTRTEANSGYQDTKKDNYEVFFFLIVLE